MTSWVRMATVIARRNFPKSFRKSTILHMREPVPQGTLSRADKIRHLGNCAPLEVRASMKSKKTPKEDNGPVNRLDGWIIDKQRIIVTAAAQLNE